MVEVIRSLAREQEPLGGQYASASIAALIIDYDPIGDKARVYHPEVNPEGKAAVEIERGARQESKP